MKYWVVPIYLLLGATIGAAQSTSAADLYRAAGQSVPKRTSPAEEFVWQDVFDAPLDKPANDILKRAGESLELFDSSSKMAFGEWGFNSEDPMAGAILLNGGEDLAGLVVLRARLRMARGDYAGALDDSFNIAQLARRLSVEPSLMRQRQQTVIFEKAMQLAASMVIDAPPEFLAHFVDRLSELRSPIDPVELAKATQKSYISFYRGLIASPRWRSMAPDMGKPLNEMFGLPGTRIDVNDLAADAELADAVFAQAQSAADEMIAALHAAGGERDAAMVIIPTRYRATHPLVRGACDLVVLTHRLDRSEAAIEKMLKKAVEISAHQPIDPEAARKAAGEFQYSKSPGGFDLKYVLFGNPTPTILHVGPRPLRSPAQPATMSFP
ncbi:MAG TPA: hypothetical protein VHD56_14040 [Tepidisphaeraceae bacterium]|nr:hypothetical protein [Tepidisphaeraceae bacterium]